MCELYQTWDLRNWWAPDAVCIWVLYISAKDIDFLSYKVGRDDFIFMGS